MGRYLKNHAKKNILTIIQSGLVIILIVLVMLMMVQIRNLQGTARVLNYAGLVRGATQREVKLEITGTKNDELIQYLDNVLSGLKYQDGHYDLVRLKDENYQAKLDVQMNYWQSLKREIAKVRENGYENTDIVKMSETYFGLADDTVSAAERYSETIASRIRWLEIFSVIDMVALGVVPAKDFVGRYGGDEFIAILYQTDRRGVKNVLLALQENVDEFNDHGKGERVSYAQGWAISSDYSHCTLQTLFDAADKYMYTNKQREKLGRQD